MRRTLIVVLAIALSFSLTSFAQTAAPTGTPALEPVPEEQRASPDEVHALFEAIGAKKQAEDIARRVQAQISSMIDEEMQKQSPPPSPRVMQEIRNMREAMMNSMNFDDMLNDMASTYQKYLTRDEIVAIRAFYESPAGQSMRVKMPAIMQEYMQVSMPKQMKRMEAAVADLQERMKKVIADEKAEKPDN